MTVEANVHYLDNGEPAERVVVFDRVPLTGEAFVLVGTDTEYHYRVEGVIHHCVGDETADKDRAVAQVILSEAIERHPVSKEEVARADDQFPVADGGAESEGATYANLGSSSEGSPTEGAPGGDGAGEGLPPSDPSAGPDVAGGAAEEPSLAERAARGELSR